MKVSTENAAAERLTRGSLLARNATLRLLAQAAPLLVAVVSVPIAVHGLGTDRFGVLGLAWMVVGYFSLFDLGLGRALTKLVGDKLGSGEVEQIPAMIRTCLALMVLLGVCALVLVILLGPWLVYRVLEIPEALQVESLWAFRLIALCIPVIMSSAAMRGVLAAHQRFGVMSIVETSYGTYTLLAPLLVLPFTTNLVAVIAATAVGTCVVWGVYLALCLRAVAAYGQRTGRWSPIKPLVRLGGWMTVSNVIGPIMINIDRFLIGAWVSTAAVTFYVVPYQMITKMWMGCQAVGEVLFPAFATSLTSDRRRAANLYKRGFKAVLLMTFPPAFMAVTFAGPILHLWLGEEFAREATRVMQWLTIGVLVNSCAQIVFGFVQGAGRPDLTAKLHIAELPLYLAGAVLLIGHWGITGAAIAWTLRIVFDMCLLSVMARRILGEERVPLRDLELPLILATGAMLVPLVPMGLAWRVGFFLVTAAVFAWTGWRYLLEADVRELVVASVRAKQFGPATLVRSLVATSPDTCQGIPHEAEPPAPASKSASVVLAE